jgi:recombination protein RecA
MARPRIQETAAPTAAIRRRKIITEPPIKVPDERSVKFIPSGSKMFDLVLAGGWGQGRIINIVGDKSSGKTLLAIEAVINCVRLSGTDHVRYAEAEAAFDEDYARSLGMPDGIAFARNEEGRGLQTVEDFYKDLDGWLKTRTSGKPCLYVLDSLDSLSDDKEMESEIGTASYGAAKAKKMSEMFRKLTQKIEDANCTLFIISQIRDKLDAGLFGEKKTRSGGKALDFYASQIVWLAELGKIKKTSKGIERIIGTQVQARTKKNKIGMPFRDCELNIIFSYGVDDEESMLAWLKKNKAESLLSVDPKEIRADLIAARADGDRESVRAINKMLFAAVAQRWQEVEAAIAPTMRKYA